MGLPPALVRFVQCLLWNLRALIPIRASSNKAPTDTYFWSMLAESGDTRGHSHDDRYYTRATSDGRYVLRTTPDWQRMLVGDFRTPIFNNNGSFIASVSGGFSELASSTNIDHIWHDDGPNVWHMCSDTPHRAKGNSTVQAGKFLAGSHEVWHKGNLNPAQMGARVTNHVTNAVLYGNSADRHISALDTSITTMHAGSDVQLVAMINYEAHHDAVFYIKRDGVEIGSAGVAGNRPKGLTTLQHDADLNSTMATQMILFTDEHLSIGVHTYTFHCRARYGGAFALNRTMNDGDLDIYERAASHIIIEEKPN